MSFWHYGELRGTLKEYAKIFFWAKSYFEVILLQLKDNLQTEEATTKSYFEALLLPAAP
jgi:hypothetical protein